MQHHNIHDIGEIIRKRGVNPLLAIGTAIVIALSMVIFTTVNFLHSGAYMTVKQIQIGIKAEHILADEDLDTDSPINASDLDVYANSMHQKIKILDDTADFGPGAVSDQSLDLR